MRDNLEWTGYVTACQGNMLLGGNKHHESSPFATMVEAQRWVSVVVETNCGAGRQISAWGTTSKVIPED